MEKRGRAGPQVLGSRINTYQSLPARNDYGVLPCPLRLCPASFGNKANSGDPKQLPQLVLASQLWSCLWEDPWEGASLMDYTKHRRTETLTKSLTAKCFPERNVVEKQAQEQKQ